MSAFGNASVSSFLLLKKWFHNSCEVKPKVLENRIWKSSVSLNLCIGFQLKQICNCRTGSNQRNATFYFIVAYLEKNECNYSTVQRI